MFAFLRGQVATKHADIIELDVGGIGYEVHVPDPVQRKLVTDSTATLLTYCHIREDSFQIFGFLREEEKTLFKMLLGISKIGPKVALAVLSGLSVTEFRRTVLENDVKGLTKVGGVGKKMAQRIILEMNAKMGQDSELAAILGDAEDTATAETDDVIAALCALGCNLAEAKKAALTARKNLVDNASDEDLVKAALRSIARI